LANLFTLAILEPQPKSCWSVSSSNTGNAVGMFRLDFTYNNPIRQFVNGGESSGLLDSFSPPQDAMAPGFLAVGGVFCGILKLSSKGEEKLCSPATDACEMKFRTREMYGPCIPRCGCVRCRTEPLVGETNAVVEHPWCRPLLGPWVLHNHMASSTC